MKRVTTLVVAGEHFHIVHYMGKYCAINVKWITNNHLNRELNGIQMNCADTLAQCIQNVRTEYAVKQLIGDGVSVEEAVREVVINGVGL